MRARKKQCGMRKREGEWAGKENRGTLPGSAMAGLV